MEKEKDINLKIKKSKQKLIILTASVISILSLFIIAIIIVVSFFSRGITPLNNKTYHLKQGKISQLDLANNQIFEYKKAEVKVIKINQEEYDKANLINVFFDYNYKVYYKLEVIIYDFEDKKYEVESLSNLYNLNNLDKNIYSFDLKINKTIYKNKLKIEKNIFNTKITMGDN